MKTKRGFTPTPKFFDVSSQSGRGFTIVELLVSIAIIAVLFAIVIAAIDTMKEKSRDSRRMADLHEIENALTLYVVENKRFPISAKITITGSDPVSEVLESAGTISEVPADPLSIGQYVYEYESLNGNFYIITFCLETNSISGYSQGCENTITP